MVAPGPRAVIILPERTTFCLDSTASSRCSSNPGYAVASSLRSSLILPNMLGAAQMAAMYFPLL